VAGFSTLKLKHPRAAKQRDPKPETVPKRKKTSRPPVFFVRKPNKSIADVTPRSVSWLYGFQNTAAPVRLFLLSKNIKDYFLIPGMNMARMGRIFLKMRRKQEHQR